MQDLGGLFHGLQVFLARQPVDGQGDDAVEGLHLQVVVGIPPELDGGVDEVRGYLTVVTLCVSASLNQASSAGYGLVLRVGLDALNEVLKRLFREFQRVLSVSEYK